MSAKEYLAVVLLLFCLNAFGQRAYLKEADIQIVSVLSDTSKTHATINYGKREINPKHEDRFYYSYNGGEIRKMQAGINGIPLHGEYKEYYADKSLKSTGYFKKGLKHGVWKNWDQKGNLISICRWKNGVRTKKCKKAEEPLDTVPKHKERKQKESLAKEEKSAAKEEQKPHKEKDKKSTAKERKSKEKKVKKEKSNDKNKSKEIAPVTTGDDNKETKKEKKKKEPKKKWRMRIFKKNQECPEIEKGKDQ